jgi:tetratricopeptide (TPR) repeat protein
MSERYSKLFGLPENLYAEGAPVVISAGALLKDNQTSKMLAQFKFKNISQKQIKALKIKIKAFDVFGVQLEDITEYQYLDLSAPRDSEFGQKQAIPLPYNVTRSISCEVVSAVFADGETWENTGAQWKPIAPQETLSNRLGKLAPQYQRDTIKQAQFVVADERDLWLCACGAINGQSEAKCHACESGKAALLAALDTEKLAQHKVVFDEEEAEKNAKNAAEQKKKKAKTKKICIIAGAAAVVVIAAVLVITMVIVPSGNYNSAVALMNEGKYEEAITAFGKLGDYKDSQALLSEAKQEQSYQDALALLNGGEYEEAISAFEELKEYKDSAAKISEIESMMAEQAK